jgi:hypothetical protein
MLHQQLITHDHSHLHHAQQHQAHQGHAQCQLDGGLAPVGETVIVRGADRAVRCG